ncbi:APC family permease [Alicyclobacillus sp. ALC3]|uniref:APC family permease n=1 Tax=Alicyclobacillus sp. ALC3 TaxID=2796143 RepID=UPI002378B37D|nr:APC family permease [Alicyclobacillus sp. ALC3]WDL98555.1 APC family permease [Alicyclobacillus sp. ALC3]
MNGKLRRDLTLYDFMMISAGAVLGSGWLFGAFYSAQYAGPAAIVAWIIGGLLMMILALPLAEIASGFPEAGSMVRYPSLSHGSFLSALQGWSLLFGYGLSPAIEAEASVQYAGGYIHGLYNGTTLTSAGLGVTAFMVVIYFVINYFGVRLFAKSNSVITTIKYLVPILTMVVLLITGLTHGGGANLSSASPGGFMPFGFRGVLVAIAVGGIYFSYTGFRQAMDLAAEGKNPKRDVPRVMITVLLLAIILYVLLQVAFIVALRHGDLAHGWARLNFSSPFAQLALALNIGWMAAILYGDSALSPFGNGLVYFGSATRLLFAMPKSGYGPKWARRLSKRGAPVPAMVVVLVMSLLSLLPFPAWGQMVGILSSVGVMSYALSGVSVAVLRRTTPTTDRPFSLKGHIRWIGPVAFIVGTLIFYWSGWPLVWQVDAINAGGAVIYFIYRRVNKLSIADVKAGLWFAIYMVILGVMSYIGSFGKGRGWLPFPLDTVVVIVIGLIFYYWGVASGFRTQDVIDYENGLNRDFIEEDIERQRTGTTDGENLSI